MKICHRLRVLLRTFLCSSLGAGIVMSQAWGASLPPTLVTKQEVRLLEELHRGSSSDELFEVATDSLRGLRGSPGARLGSGPRRHDAQYLDALLLAKFSSIYDLLFDSQKKKAFEKEVIGIKLSTLFDGFMEMIVQGSIPDSMKSAGDKIGACLAAKVIDAKPSCELDEEGLGESKPSMVRLAAMRATCGILSSHCEIRKTLFAAAREELEKARNSDSVQKQIAELFERVYPERFRQGLLAELATIRGTHNQWVASKFFPETASLVPATRPRLVLDDQAPMFVADEELSGQGYVHRLDGAAHGLLADLAIARWGQRVLKNDPNSAQVLEQVSETASAFWSSVQQLLVMTGGTKAIFAGKDKGYELIEGDLKNLPPRFSKESPYLKGELFGGWSVTQIQSSPEEASTLRFAPWDWEKYIDLPTEKGAPISFFPHQFKLDEQGRPMSVGLGSAVQTLEDHVALVDALAQFLEITEEGGIFARHLGPEDSLADAIDPAAPILLPSQARLLGYAMVAGIVRNLTHPDHALIEKQATIEPGQGLGVKFFESSSLNGGERPQAKTTSVASLILVAAKFRDRVAKDPQFPVKDRSEILGMIDSIVTIGALTLGAQAQNQDGSFRATLNSADLSPDLLSTILALRAIQTAHLTQGVKVLTLNLKSGMKFLSQHLPQASGVRALTPEARLGLWHFLLLWDQAKPDWSEAIFGQEGHETRKQWEKALLETLNSGS